MQMMSPGFEELRHGRTPLAAGNMADRHAAEIDQVVDTIAKGQYGEGFRHLRSIYAQGAGLPHPPIVDGRYPMPQRMAHDIHAYAQDSVVVDFWQKHRTVYDMDKELWEQLGYTEPDDVVPSWLFSHLPHPNPYLSFPAMIFPLAGQSVDDIQVQSVAGVFITGYKYEHGRVEAVDKATGVLLEEPGRIMCSTHDPDVVGLQLLFVGETFDFVHNGDGTVSPKRHMAGPNELDYLFTRTSLEITDGLTFEKVVEAALNRFHRPSYLSHNDDVTIMLSRATAALMYICATNADLFPLPAPPVRNKKAKGGRPKKQTRVVQVGARIGAELRAYARSHGESRGTGTGKARAPHIRRAHFHTYKVGPGRQEEIVKWLAPIPINFDAEAPQAATVHRVRGKV